MKLSNNNNINDIFHNKQSFYAKELTISQIFKSSLIAVCVGTLCRPIQFYFLMRARKNSQLIGNRANQTNKIEQFRTFMRQAIKADLKNYFIFLIVKECAHSYINTQQNTFNTLFIPWIIGFVSGFMFFNSSRHKIQYVNVILRENQLLKKLKQQKVGFFRSTYCILQQRSIGRVSHSFAVATYNLINFGFFDLAHNQNIITQQNMPKSIVFGALFNIIAIKASIVFSALSDLKIKSKMIKEKNNIKLYQSQSYYSLIPKLKNNQKIKYFNNFSIMRLLYSIRNGVILTAYTKSKQYFQSYQYNN